MEKVKILLVDDDEVDREMIRKSLHVIGADIVEVANGTDCLKQLAEGVFSLILLDYKLPDFDGLELISLIKKTSPITPIVVVTGFGNEELVQVTSKAGALDYIPKNKISPEFLTRTILNDLLIHKAQLDKQRAKEELERQRKENIELQRVIALAKEKIAEYEKEDLIQKPH